MQDFYHIEPKFLLAGIAILFLGLISIFIISQKRFTKSIWFGIFSFLIFIGIGASTVVIHDHKNYQDHYTNSIKNFDDSAYTINLKISEILKPNKLYSRYVADVIAINHNQMLGRIILNIQKDSALKILDVDDQLILNSAFIEISSPLNPNQFDYKKYLEKRYIYHQVFLKKEQYHKLELENTTIKGLADNIKTHINSKLQSYDFKQDELAVISALILGQRRDMSEQVYNNYVNAGAVHILAVSGLHVGIMLILLNFLFKPIAHFKYGRIIKTVIILLLLWSFAVIAGLSPSVMRAVTMFSFVAVAMNLKRPTNIYNTLAMSAFFILLFKPLFLFDVGFQLSYTAILSIVAIDPLLYRLWQPKSKVLNFYWHTLTVTIAAQVGILPISLYYFHQFPTLFFISNLIIIPVLGFILGFGILIILLAVLNILPDFLASIFGKVITLMNLLVEWVASQKEFIIQDIYFSLLYLIVFYFLILSIFKWIKRRNFRTLAFILLAIIFVQGSILYTRFSRNPNQAIIFHKTAQTLIGNNNNNILTFASSVDTLDYYDKSILKNYSIENQLDKLEKEELKQIYIFNQKKLLIIDSLGTYHIKSFKPDYVLLRQSPKINLDRLIDSLKPQIIIADGSNYKSSISYWRDVCKKRKIPFHNTAEKGAFIIY